MPPFIGEVVALPLMCVDAASHNVFPCSPHLQPLKKRGPVLLRAQPPRRLPASRLPFSQAAMMQPADRQAAKSQAARARLHARAQLQRVSAKPHPYPPNNLVPSRAPQLKGARPRILQRCEAASAASQRSSQI